MAWTRRLALTLAAGAMSAAPGVAPSAPGTPAALVTACEALVHSSIADVRVITAAVMQPGEKPFADDKIAPPAVAFCRLQGVIETEIRFELWLPEAAHWNHRYLAGGVGGQAGQLNYRELVRGIDRGYAAASTDTGHTASDTHWLLGDPMRAANYAERANHLLAEKSKAIISAYFGSPAAHSFFVGCSGGGRQALTEVQRFPADYDGVIAGAPGTNTPEMSARRLWEMVQHSAHAGLMTPDDWQLIAADAVRQCDALDGVKDGVIDDPSRCPFDIGSLRCGAQRHAGCLNGDQIDFARKIYAPLRDENRRIVDEGLLPGVQVQPAPVPEPFTPGPRYLAVVLFADGVHRDPNWDARKFRMADDLPAIDKVMDLHADDPNLQAFKRAGGKLILYQGWADPLVAAQPTVSYFKAVQRAMGGPGSTRAFLRLYMVPGMGHCTGGYATDQFGGAGAEGPALDPEHNLLSALERWVDHGVAPARVIASRIEHGSVVRTRPLCPYPQKAHYLGNGATDDADHFRCQ